MYNILLFFQGGAAATAAVAENADENIFSLVFHNVFAAVIMICLLIMSIIAVSIFISRFSTIKNATVINDSFMNNIRAHVQNGNIGAARALCQSTDSPIARMVEKGYTAKQVRLLCEWYLRVRKSS